MGELCGTLTKPSRGLPPTRWVGESGVTSSGWSRFEFLKPPHQRVVFGVADLGLVEDVVQVLVTMQLIAQLVDFLCHGPGAHLL